MDKEMLPALQQESDDQWLVPEFDFPVVPGSEASRELVEMEAQARAALAYLDAIPKLVEIARNEVRATGGTNMLYFWASTQRVVIDQRTPCFKILEDRLVIEMPEFIRRA
jgi:hypothetical protein